MCLWLDQTREKIKNNIPGNNILVLPADLVRQTADGAVLATGLQAQDTQSLGNDHLLLLVVGRGNTLEDLQALQSGGTTGGLVGDHATDGLVEDARGGAEVEGTWKTKPVSKCRLSGKFTSRRSLRPQPCSHGNGLIVC